MRKFRRKPKQWTVVIHNISSYGCWEGWLQNDQYPEGIYTQIGLEEISNLAVRPEIYTTIEPKFVSDEVYDLFNFLKVGLINVEDVYSNGCFACEEYFDIDRFYTNINRRRGTGV